MDETLRQLGGILLRAVPTFLLVVLLHFYLKFIFFKPLGRILRQRYEATEGARKLAEASLAKAAEKAAEYEAALRAARAETYKELEQLRRQLQDDRAVAVREARAGAEKRAAAMDAKLANLGAEVETLRKSAREEAAMEGDRIRQETQRELAKIQANAGHDIASALKSAKIELKSYSGQLAIHLARDKVRQRMTPADQDALVRSFVSDLGRQEGTTQ